MATLYLLKCSCGRSHRVQARQAGQSLDCSCGETIEVPTIRGLQKLKQVGAVHSETSPGWGRREGLVFLGGIVCLAGIVASAVLQGRKARLLEENAVVPFEQYDGLEERIHAQAERLSPAEAWSAWRGLRHGVQRNLSPSERSYLLDRDQKIAANRRTASQHNSWTVLACAIAVLGAINAAFLWYFLSPQRRASGSSGMP
jgi:hypothetical protein